MGQELAQDAASYVAEDIEDNGDTITFKDGTTTKAIVDVQPESIAKEMDVMPLSENPKGQLAVFHFAAGTFPIDTRSLVRHGQTWALYPARVESYSDVVVRITALGNAQPIM